ncbi:MAG: protein kinase [Polyangiaceae bacterium]
MIERVVGDRFELLGRAGVGGAAEVYRARDRHSGATVALKLMFGLHPDSELRFGRECSLLATVDDPAIVRYVAHGRSDASHWLAMEWIEGPSLSKWFKRNALTRAQAVELVERVATAVGALHRRGIVHRDIKPGNILLEDGDPARPKLIDLGIARGKDDEAFTATGMIVGTVGFMSPEQAGGLRDVDARSDVFSLGCLLFRCIAGDVPFAADDPLAALLRLTIEEARRLSTVVPDVSPELDDAVARMLVRKRDARPADGVEVARMLRALLEGGAIDESSELSRTSLTEIPSAVTTTERRMIFLVLGRSTAFEAGREAEAFQSFGRALASLGLRPELLVDGTAVVVVSGTSTTAGDLALRAARAALAMRAAFPDVVGVVTTGRAALVGLHGIGEAIERGSALLGRARASGAPGELFVDPSAERLLAERFELRPSTSRGASIAPPSSAGREPRARVLVGEKGRAGMGLTTAASAFVGRERELAFLRSLAEEAESESRATAVLLLAPPGTGKSRLARELVRKLDLGKFGVWTAEADPLATSSPLHLLATLVARGMGVNRSDTRPESRAEAYARLATWVSRAAPDDAGRVTSFVAELLGLGDLAPPSPALESARRDPTLMGDQLRRAFVDLVRGATAVRGLLLLLDDVQWADHASMAFLDAALRTLEARPVVVVCLGRPETKTALPLLFQGRSVHELRLEPLGRAAASRLVRARSSASDDVLEQILERAGGNPFFLEELARAATEGDDLAALPDSVLAIVDARLDAFPSECRRVLRAASVFGRAFSSAGVRALLPGIDVGRCLAELEQREVVERVADGDEGPDWVFRNGLLLDAAYARLPVHDRQRAHLRAAHFLEHGGERDPAILAEHFLRGGDPASAIGLLASAAELALEASDLPQAAELSKRAIASGASGTELGMLHAYLAEAELWRGHNAECLVAAREALAILPAGSAGWCRAAAAGLPAAGRTNDRSALEEIVEALVALRTTGRELGRVEAPADAQGTAGAEGSASAAPEVWSPDRITAWSQAAIQLVFQGRVDEAGALLDAIPVAAAQREPGAGAWVARARAWRALSAGDPGAFGMLMRRSAASFDMVGDLRNACVQRNNVAYACMNLGQLEDAVRGFRGVLVSARELGLGMVESVAHHNLGLALAWLGELTEAETTELEAVRAFEAQEDARMLAASWAYLARIRALAHDFDRAEEAARKAVEIAPPRSPTSAAVLGALAEVLLDRGGDPDEALAVAEEARRIVEEVGGVDEGEALLRAQHARALERAGRHEESARAFAESAAWLTERAKRITPESARETFLARVPENRALQRRASPG